MIDMDIEDQETAFTLRSIRPILPQVPRLWPIVDSSLATCEPVVEDQPMKPDLARDEQGRLFLIGNLDSIDEAIDQISDGCHRYLSDVAMADSFNPMIEVALNWHVAMLLFVRGHTKIEIEHADKRIEVYFCVESGIDPKLFLVRELSTESEFNA